MPTIMVMKLYIIITWQSQVEIKHFSVAYFKCITTFKVQYHRLSVKGRTHTCCIDMSGIHSMYKLMFSYAQTASLEACMRLPISIFICSWLQAILPTLFPAKFSPLLINNIQPFLEQAYHRSVL